MKIEKVSLETVDQAANIYLQSFGQLDDESSPVQRYEYCRDYVISRMSDMYLVHDEDYAGIFRLCDGEISGLYVRPAFRRKGYGTAAVRYAQDMCNELRLIVLSSNWIAVKMYERLGFVFGEDNAFILVGKWKRK